MKSKTISIFIKTPPSNIIEYVANPENLPQWANAFCLSVKKLNNEWIIQTTRGQAKISFVARNEFGVLDHVVSPVPGVELYIPVRVIPNETGSEILFTLFQYEGMSDLQFIEDIQKVQQDLYSLKRTLENHTHQPVKPVYDPVSLEKLFFTALINADISSLNTLLTDDFILIDVMTGAEITKTAFLGVILSSDLKFESIDCIDSRLRYYPETAIITGSTQIKGKFKKSSFSVHSRYTHVYIQQQGLWRFVSAQGTAIPQGINEF